MLTVKEEIEIRRELQDLKREYHRAPIGSPWAEGVVLARWIELQRVMAVLGY